MDNSNDEAKNFDNLISFIHRLKDLGQARAILEQEHEQNFESQLNAIITEEFISFNSADGQDSDYVSRSLDEMIDEEIDKLFEFNLNISENKKGQEPNNQSLHNSVIRDVINQESNDEEFEIIDNSQEIAAEGEIVRIREEVIFSCKLCLEQHSIDNSETFGCSHVFCRMCLTNFLASKVNDGNVLDIICPEEGCTTKAEDWMIRSLLPHDKRKRYELFVFKKITERLDDVMNCPECNELVECDLAVGNGICQKCNFAFCTSCSKAFHGTDDCPDVSQRLQESAISEELIKRDYKKCPGCNTNIEKDEFGCNHMTCARCSTEFCWICLNKITDLETHYSRCELFNHGIGE